VNRARVCLERGAFSEAEKLCRESLEVHPASAPLRLLLAQACQAQGNIDAAQNELKSAVKADPLFAEAWLYWAKLLQSRGHAAKAEDCLRLGLTRAPQAVPLHNALAMIQLSLEKPDDAAETLERAAGLFPQSETVWFNLGIVRKRQQKLGEAASAYRRVIAINPDIAEAHNNLGDVLKDRDMEAAADAFKAALRLQPNYAEALDNLGVIYFFKGLLPQALEKFEQALDAKPDFHRALAHMTTALFMAGRLPEAWTHYKMRFVVEGLKHDPHGRFQIPILSGESLTGKRALIWTELGLGEEILQAGMFPDVLKAASRVTVECSPRLEKLFARSFPGISFIARTNPTRACPLPIEADVQIAGGDLGGLFRRDWNSFPNHNGYLIADAARVAVLRQKYSNGPANLIVGLSWASGKSNLGKDKTLPLSAFAPLLRQPGVTFVNLQYAANPQELDDMAALGIDIVTDDAVNPMGDMDEVAAQVAAMDLVISVSNTNAHMAGALNVPVWNILPAHNASGMWHWFSDSERSHWYPSMQIFRRTEGATDGLMATLSANLQALAAAPKRGAS